MIDEKGLIERFETAKHFLFHDECGRQTISVDKIIDLLKNAEKVGEWIPVSEGLPKDRIPVNITWINRKPVSYYMHIKDKPFTATGILCHGAWYWFSTRCEDGSSKVDAMDEHIEVIAWQPLSEPYREESVE